MKPALVPAQGRQRDGLRESDPLPPAPPGAGPPWTHRPTHKGAHDPGPGAGGKVRPPPPRPQAS